MSIIVGGPDVLDGNVVPLYSRLRLILSNLEHRKFTVFRIYENGNFVGLLHNPYRFILNLALFCFLTCILKQRMFYG